MHSGDHLGQGTDSGSSREGHLSTASAQKWLAPWLSQTELIREDLPEHFQQQSWDVGKLGYCHQQSKQVCLADIFRPNLNSSFSPLHPEEARVHAHSKLKVATLREALWLYLPFPALSEGRGCSLTTTSQCLVKSIRKLLFI